MKRAKRLYALLGVLAVVCVATLIVVQYEQEKEEIRTSGEVVLEVDADAVETLSWENESESLAFHKEDGWVYDGDAAFPVSEDKINELLDVFSSFSAAFIIEDVTFGVGQINSMDARELEEIKENLLPNMQNECGKHGMQMVFFMLTNIIEESTELLYYGSGAKELIARAFEKEVPEESCRLEGVVSRKKQLIPAFMMALQNQ